MSINSPLSGWSFDDLVDEVAGDILKGLIAGKFRQAVFSALDLAIRWRDAQNSLTKNEG
jgi:hypothetical protein